jgi:hypothetical protein
MISIKNVTGPKYSQIDGPHPPPGETLLPASDGDNGGVNDGITIPISTAISMAPCDPV